MKSRFLSLMILLSLSGCGVLGGGAIREYEQRIGEIDGMIENLENRLTEDLSPQDRHVIEEEIAHLKKKKLALGKKKAVAEKATETAGAGIEGLLGILGVLLGVPLLGTVGGVAKNILVKGG
jgi:hypothetical protein